jgi:hypothetical protein
VLAQGTELMPMARAARGSRTLSTPASDAPLLEMSCRAARFVSREAAMGEQVRGLRRVSAWAAGKFAVWPLKPHEKLAGFSLINSQRVCVVIVRDYEIIYLRDYGGASVRDYGGAYEPERAFRRGPHLINVNGYPLNE